MKLKKGRSYLAITIHLSLWTLIVFVVPTFAQRGVSGGRGSISRPEKMERAAPTPTPDVIQPPLPSPGASPAVSIKETSEVEEPEKPGQDPGSFFFIYGVNALARPRQEEGTATKLVGGFSFNVYVTRRIFLEVDNDNFISLKPLEEARTTGFGDTLLIVGGDAVLENKETWKPNLTFSYGIKLPSASVEKGLGSGKVDHQLTGTLNKQLSGNSIVELDFLEYFAKRGAGNGFAKTSSLAAFWRQWLSDKHTNRFHFEVGGTFKTKESNAEMYTLDYIEHFPTKNLSFRIGGKFGLTPNVPRAGVYVALTLQGKLE